MHTLVIGGMQFMGRRIVELLLDAGHDVSVLHRGPTHDFGPAVRNLQADRSDVPTVSALVTREQFDVIVDTAYDWQRGTPASHIEAVADHAGDRLQRYVFMSSIAAYQPGLGLRESDPLVPDDSPNPYAQHKASAERALFAKHRVTGFPVVTIRPPYVHGPRQPFYREAFFWDRLLDGRPIVLPDGGDAPTHWVFVEDVARVCMRAIDEPKAVGHSFNIAHTEPLTQRTFVEALARVAGVEPRLVAVARATIQAEGGQLVGRQIYFGEFLDLAPMTSVVDKAREVLGVTPTPLDEALREGFAWYTRQPRRPVDYTFEDRLIETSVPA